MNEKERSKLILGYNQKKLKIVYVIDNLASFFLKPYLINRSHHPPSDFKKILVIQSHLIGDVLMVTPMLKALKKAYPDSQIYLLANKFAGDLLNGLPFIDHIITMKFPWSTYDYSIKNMWCLLKTIKYLRNISFDLAIDAQIDFRNAFLMYLTGAKRRLGYAITGGRVFLTDSPEFPENLTHLLEARLSILRHLDIDTSDITMELTISEEAKQWAASFIDCHRLHEEKMVAIHPGASMKEKLWESYKFAAIADYLCSKGYVPVLIEGPKEKRTVNEIKSLCNKQILTINTFLKNIVALIKRCKFLICLDSGILHIATAVGTPTVALYGPRWPDLTRPLYGNSIIIFKNNIECRPCEYGRCIRGQNDCMRSIEIEEVRAAIKHILKNDGIISPLLPSAISSKK